jgi:hypothetical protein
MKRFGYWRDPLCLVACALYALNRLWLRAHVGGGFLAGYFDDLLLIPAALPLLLWIQRKVQVRARDTFPGWDEIALHLAVWAVIAELVMPRITRRATADWWDFAAYAAGAVLAGLWWHLHLEPSE